VNAGTSVLGSPDAPVRGAAADRLLVEITERELRWSRAGGAPEVATRPRAGAAWDWRAALGRLPAPAGVLVANGAGDAAAGELREFVAAAWRLEPEFLAPRAHAAGLTCPECHVVGVDRWLAMVAAVRRAQRAPCVVVTCGAALAIDLVDAGGRHRGGYVVPGIRRMREALFARTGSLAALAALSPPAVAGLYGVNTAGAIEQGSRIALASLAERAVHELGVLQGTVVRGYVAGDECEELRSELAGRFEHVPALVLEGLAIVATEATR
jgi:type III pantothenate kinase